MLFRSLAVQSYSDPLRTMFIMFARVCSCLLSLVLFNLFFLFFDLFVNFDKIQVNEDAGSFYGTAMPADERFKLALGELIIWLGSTN